MHRNFNVSLNDFLDIFYNRYKLLDWNLNLFYSININNFLDKNLYLFNLLYSMCNNNYFLFFNRDLNNIFLFLWYYNWFLNYSLYNLILNLWIRNLLVLNFVLHSLNYFLNNFFYLTYF
jgi:hypothetical protein